MKINIKHNGVTLTELLVVVVLMGIIATIGVVVIGNLISNTEIKAYEKTVDALNDATNNYVLWDQISTQDVFEGLETNSQRIETLFSQGYITKVIQPNTPYSFVWDIDSQLWVLSSEEIVVSVSVSADYNFSEDSLTAVIEQGGVISSGSFTDNGESISTAYGILLIDNSKTNYTINVSAQLNNQTSGGFGIFLETTIDENNKDTGFIVQVDRGYSRGEIIIRPRTNGSEGDPIHRYGVGFDAMGDFVASGGERSNSNPWWAEKHDVKLVVADITEAINNKQVSVYIDNVFLFTYKFTSAITSETVSQNQTGLRVWSQNTIFYSFNVT